jgi:hypothetical protein
MTEEEKGEFRERWDRLREWMISEGFCNRHGSLGDRGRRKLTELHVSNLVNDWVEAYTLRNCADSPYDHVTRIWVPDSDSGPCRWHYMRPYYAPLVDYNRTYDVCELKDLEMLEKILGYRKRVSAAQLLDDEMDTL